MAGAGAPTPLRVVVIEEADDLRLLLRFALELEPGIEVVDAAAALEHCTTSTDDVDVVLVDHHMSTARRKQTIGAVAQRWPDAAVVLAGSRLDEAQLREAEAAGVAAFVSVRGDVNEAAQALRQAAATRPR